MEKNLGKERQEQMFNESKELVEHYKKTFKSVYGNPPLVEEDGRLICQWSIETFGLERSKEYIDSYFMLDDEWLKTQVFPLAFYKKQINKVIASCGSMSKLPQKLYTVGFTESGRAVNDKNQKALPKIGDLPNPLFPGVEITEEMQSGACIPWCINGKWYGMLYPFHVKQCADRAGLSEEDYMFECLASGDDPEKMFQKTAELKSEAEIIQEMQ